MPLSLQNMHKHRDLIDEILCQIVKQLTDNLSVHRDSIQRGWKLLALILNYFIPSERLRPFLLRYLHDHQSRYERLGKHRRARVHRDATVFVRSAVVFESLRTNSEVRRTKEYTEQGRDRSSHSGKERTSCVLNALPVS